MNFLQAQPQAPLFTDAEKDILRPIVVDQYRNMDYDQKNNLTNQWTSINIDNVPGFQNIWISRKSSGYPDYNVVIKRRQNDRTYDVLFNTIDIPQETRRGGKKSRRNRRPRKTRRRRTRRTRKHR